VQHAGKGPTEPPSQSLAPIRCTYTFRIEARPRQSSEREHRVKTARISVELQRGAVVNAEGHRFDHLPSARQLQSVSPGADRTGAAGSTMVAERGEGPPRGRAAPSARPIRLAVASSQESIASPGAGATRSGSLRPVATVLRSTTLTSRDPVNRGSAYEQRFCVQKVDTANDVVKR
jgi:hypothetical protein